VSLIKPHYEAPPAVLRKGILPDDQLAVVMAAVAKDIAASGFQIGGTVVSPIKGAKGNTEILALLRPAT
jgi:predicted rRNA methylase YqxC with S4 and FtsJ domains